MDLKSQKRIAAQILKCGESRVRIKTEKEVEEALTREDIRALIRKGLITTVQKKGTSRARARKTLAQKKKGRRKGTGSRKGSWGARTPAKKEWMKLIRTQRRVLIDLRESGRLDTRTCRKLLLMAKGGAFRSKKHLMFHMREKGILKPLEKPAKALVKKKPAKKAPKKTKPVKKVKK